jgi:preprotein translocase subunit YajC
MKLPSNTDRDVLHKSFFLSSFFSMKKNNKAMKQTQQMLNTILRNKLVPTNFYEDTC